MSTNTIKKKKERTSPGVHIFFIISCLIFLIPFLTVVSASFSSEVDLLKYGFRILPKRVDLTAYKYLFANPDSIIRAYAVTIFITAMGTFFGTLFMSMVAYCLARIKGRVKNFLTFYVYFPTLFSGGLTSSYIINTRYLHLQNNLAVLILPGLISVFYVFMIRTFFQQVPETLYEAAKIDGASEYTIFFKIAIALSKPVLATVAFLMALVKWNEWYNAMLYIRDDKLMTLQYLLQRMMAEIKALLDMMEHVPVAVDASQLPGENLRMAMLIVAIGPMMCFFPFFQKYFTKGMVVGAVKG